jgi:hypothetical protein
MLEHIEDARMLLADAKNGSARLSDQIIPIESG